MRYRIERTCSPTCSPLRTLFDDRVTLYACLRWILRSRPASDFDVGIASILAARLRPQPAYLNKTHLHDRIREAVKLYPCDLLFIHRDAERESPSNRVQEISEALASLPEYKVLPVICVVPVRMTEAWLIFDEQAIRNASGNSHGKVGLPMINVSRIEEHADPKDALEKLLRTASELRGRRLDKFNTKHARQRVAELIDDFGPLRSLTAFQRLESDIKRIVQQEGWARAD
jgi:hypothetical protein